MKLEITLKDPKYCDGCPCMMLSIEKGCWSCLYYKESFPLSNSAIRPQKCIDENE